MDLDAACSAIEKQTATCHPARWCSPADCRDPAGRRLIGTAFQAGTGATLTAAHVGHYLLARGDKLPISKFTTHDLRRTVATQLVEMAIPLELVAAVIGHEAGTRETRTLVRHYVRTDLVDRKKATLESWEHRLFEIIEGKLQTGKPVYLINGYAA